MTGMTLNFVPLSGENLSADIATQIRDMLDTGALLAGAKLPSTRELAKELRVARGTVVTALDTLIAEGFLVTRQGSGTFVSDVCTPIIQRPKEVMSLPERKKIVVPDVDESFGGQLNFQACRPSLEAFPQNAWRRAAADAASRLPNSDYGDPQGEPELRIAIAAYLCRARGLDVCADEIIITNGAIQAMYLLADLYLSSDDVVAFENPGYPLARQAFTMTGADILPLPVDDEGLCVDQLPPSGGNIKFVYVTPSHQFPTGQRLSLERRQALLQWAAKNDALILEDDYDGEFRYDVAPLPPMAAMSSIGSVVYFGTFSKTLFPSLRLGFAAGPRDLIKELTAYRTVTDYQTNSLSQLALATFIESGEFEKHVHRMRRIYARKRKRLHEVIAQTELQGSLTGTESGLNAHLKLYTSVSATNISDRAKLAGIAVPPIARYVTTGDVKDNALILGYGALDEQQIVEGIGKLAAIIKEAS